MTNKEMALDISKKIPYEFADDRVLVKPLKPVMILKEFPVDIPDAKNMNEAEAMEVKKFEKRKVPANTQRGVIIKVGTDYLKEGNSAYKLYEVGDVVMYPAYAGIKFELFKDSITLRRYELLGKVIE
jgi:co-chaperonin GroES (HSP10)